MDVGISTNGRLGSLKPHWATGVSISALNVTPPSSHPSDHQFIGMPSIKYSTTVLLLLELKKGNGKTAWEDQDVMKRLGILSRPKKGMPMEDVPDGLTIQNVETLARFLDSVTTHPQSKRQSFIEEGSDCHAGREVWTEWFRSHITKRLNHLVECQLLELGHHPTIILGEGLSSEWPNHKVHIQPCIAPIGFELFGPTMEDDGGYLRNEAHSYLSSLLTLNFVRLKKTWKRAEKEVAKKKTDSTRAMTCKRIFVHRKQPEISIL
jgi:hypothetical protein